MVMVYFLFVHVIFKYTPAQNTGIISMNPKTISFLFVILSFCIQTSHASFSDDDSPSSGSSSSGKRRIIDVNNFEDNGSGKVQALMSPGTEAFVNEATRLMGMSDTLIDIGGPDEEDGRERDELPGVLAKRVSERATSSRSTSSSSIKLTIQTEQTTIQSAQSSPAASTLEREFWGFILKENTVKAKRLLHRNPTFIPTLNDYSFKKMETIMKHRNTHADLLKFLYGKFSHLFQCKYQNGHYISHVTHPNNIRTLLELFPNDRNLRIVLLDEIINSPQSSLVLDESFFNFIINNDKLLKHMFNTRPDLFLVDYRQLTDGPFKQKLPVILGRLSNLFKTNDAIKMACFKISAVDQASGFDKRVLENIQDDLLREMIEFLRTVPEDQVSQTVLRAIYELPNMAHHLILSNGITPFVQAILDDRDDIYDIIVTVNTI